MNVQLTPGESKFVEDLIAAGEVRDAEEAVAEALVRWKRERELKAAIEEGVRELDAGMEIDGDESMKAIRERVARHLGLDAALAEGADDFEAGRVRDGEEVFRDLKRSAEDRIERETT